MRKPMTNKRWAITLRVGWSLAIGLALVSMLLLSPTPGSMRVISPTATATPNPTPIPCTSDIKCSDGVFCNGTERCAPAAAGADSRGCIASSEPTCSADQECDEGRRTCTTSCPPGVERDADGDGHVAVRCGGDDCNDHDANCFPGRMEVCDTSGHDEDCDPTTYGHRDQDGDGEGDFRCFNRAKNGTVNRGTDYDDNNPAVRLGSMICDGPDAVVVSGLASVPCPAGTKCAVQPNRTAICIVAPTNYVPPPRFEWPLLPESSVTLPAAMPPVVPIVTDSPGSEAAEVAECKSTLGSGKVSWGGGANWASENIDRLCNGTKNAKKTIACFQSNVEALGWAAAIEKCK